MMRKLREKNIRSFPDVERAGAILVDFSEEMRSSIAPLQTFLRERLYGHPSIAGGKEEGKRILKDLCAAYLAHPPKKILDLQERTGSTLPIAVKDYVSGMTDAFARLAALKL